MFCRRNGEKCFYSILHGIERQMGFKTTARGNCPVVSDYPVGLGGETQSGSFSAGPNQVGRPHLLPAPGRGHPGGKRGAHTLPDS